MNGSMVKNHISLKTVFGYNTENFVPIVVPGLSTSSSSSLPSSTSMTPSRQEIDYPTSSSSSSTSPPLTSSTVSSESVAGHERGDPCGMDHNPAAVSSVKSIPPTTENWLRKQYKYSKKNYKSTEDKHETNHINNKYNDMTMNTRKMHNI